jgi:hypothetical protein
MRVRLVVAPPVLAGSSGGVSEGVGNYTRPIGIPGDWWRGHHEQRALLAMEPRAAGLLLVMSTGDWVRESSREFLAVLGDHDPDYDAAMFAVRNLGFIAVRRHEAMLELVLHPGMPNQVLSIPLWRCTDHRRQGCLGSRTSPAAGGIRSSPLPTTQRPGSWSFAFGMDSWSSCTWMPGQRGIRTLHVYDESQDRFPADMPSEC